MQDANQDEAQPLLILEPEHEERLEEAMAAFI